MKKKNIIIILISVLLISALSVSVFANNPGDRREATVYQQLESTIVNDASPEEMERLMEIQASANMAANEFQLSLGAGTDGFLAYPDDYSGMWIDEDRLIVALTEVSFDSISRYQKMFGEYAFCVDFVEAKYSYGMLRETIQIVSKIVENQYQIRVMDSSVDDIKNVASIGVAIEDVSVLSALTEIYPVTFHYAEGSYK